jgi:hypothetical protein
LFSPIASGWIFEFIFFKPAMSLYHVIFIDKKRLLVICGWLILMNKNGGKGFPMKRMVWKTVMKMKLQGA